MEFIYVICIIFEASMWACHFLAEKIYENTFLSLFRALVRISSVRVKLHFSGALSEGNSSTP